MRARAAVLEHHPARALDLQEEKGDRHRRCRTAPAHPTPLALICGAVGIGHQRVPRHLAGNMLALQLGIEQAQIGAHQIGRQAIDRRLEGAVSGAAAADLRLVIAGEQAVIAAHRIGREVLFKEMPWRRRSHRRKARASPPPCRHSRRRPWPWHRALPSAPRNCAGRRPAPHRRLPLFQSGRSEKRLRDRCRLAAGLRLGGCGGGLVQAASANSARTRSRLLRNIAGGRHQHPIGVRGIQVALEGPHIDHGAGWQIRR